MLVNDISMHENENPVTKIFVDEKSMHEKPFGAGKPFYFHASWSCDVYDALDNSVN